MSLSRFHPFFFEPFDEADWQLAFSHPRKASRRHSQQGPEGRDVMPSLRADVIEREREYEIHADLPGVDPADVEVTVANGMVHISAERKQVHEEKSEFSHRIERSFGRVQRSVPIPENAVQDSADCRFDNGVLTIVMGKKPAMEPGRKLQIKTGASPRSPSSGSSA